MGSRVQRLFLALLLALAFPLPLAAQAQDPLGRVITPDLERRELTEANLDEERFELGVYYGLLSIEDFGSNPVAGVMLAYHITEDFFFEANYAQSKAQETSYELLSGAVELLTEDERDYRYYSLALGYKLLPGQMYLGDRRALNTHVYLIAGAGNTQFAEQTYFTYTLGAGFRLYALDWLALDLGMRGHSFRHELLGVSKTANNLEARVGLNVFF
ncbi:outer membrane beta-barrel domain-containing protein [Marinimicrobium alkaliphilum]|uniref:outer membrane beta-barrel domain-containing protein n=1 Tax=Marinimicrobium alkaliphilum TaxID=2202654 RepID=UPI000DB9C191|nr:outer membrane beta-barrel domain-containing protein [Marinimicrobium alkaliphilum]